MPIQSSTHRTPNLVINGYVLLLVIALPTIGWGTTLTFSVETEKIGPVFAGESVDVPSPDLKGTVLAGQNLSLDLVFSDKLLARLFLSKPGAFGVELIVYTNTGTFPGFAGPTDGYLLDEDGRRYGDAQKAGRADGDDGSFSVGLVSFTPESLKRSGVVDIKGVHFDTILPNNKYIITNAVLRFSLNTVDDRIKFGTVRQLSDQNSR